MKENKIKLHITHVDGEYELMLGAVNMKELIDVKLPEWIPTLEASLPLFKTTKRFKKDPVGEEKKERESGWYYDV